ncbi:hypothetical protein ABVT39_011767 [Epinephelus coioides]
MVCGAAAESLSSLSADATGQLDIFGHDSDSLGVDGAQVGVLKQAHQALEGQLADEQLRGFLVATDLSQSHGTGPVMENDAVKRGDALLLNSESGCEMVTLLQTSGS